MILKQKMCVDSVNCHHVMVESLSDSIGICNFFFSHILSMHCQVSHQHQSWKLISQTMYTCCLLLYVQLPKTDWKICIDLTSSILIYLLIAFRRAFSVIVNARHMGNLYNWL